MNREELIQSIEHSLNSSGLSDREKVRALSNVLIDYGCALESISEPVTTTTLKKIEQDYYQSPTLGKALIMQGSLMLTWGATH